MDYNNKAIQGGPFRSVSRKAYRANGTRWQFPESVSALSVALGKGGWDNTVNQKTSNAQSSKSLHRHGGGVYSTAVSKGWRPTCDCENDGSGKCIVLDPFAGSGTTCVVAEKHGRAWMGIEQNPEYCKLAEERISKVRQKIEEEQRETSRQQDLFAEAAQ